MRNDGNRTEEEIDSLLETWQKFKCSDEELKTLRDNAVLHVADFTTQMIAQKDKELLEREQKLDKREKKVEKKKKTN